MSEYIQFTFRLNKYIITKQLQIYVTHHIEPRIKSDLIKLMKAHFQIPGFLR